MKIIYNILISLVEKLLPITKVFSVKMASFVEGRKNTFRYIEKNIHGQDQVIWVHAASLGEYEQGVPILKKLRETYPSHKIFITFFSPSGYEVKKNNEFAHWTAYLPLDTKSNAKRFINLVSPELIFFIKYEIWPNYLQEAKTKNIPALLISGNFRPGQIYFKPYGKFFKRALWDFDHLFVQNTSSRKILKTHGFEKVTISGDTRFDRVSSQLNMDNRLSFVETFKGDKLCIVCGSTWPEDEELLKEYINSSSLGVKFIIAPHQIKAAHIAELRKKMTKLVALYSESGKESLGESEVLIVDTVGLLTKIYAYADIAYVGGAAGNTGLHNILEPAAFGLPIIIGKNHDKFPEAAELQRHNGLFSVKSSEEATRILDRLVTDRTFRQETGQHSRQFIHTNRGATKIVVDFIRTHYNFEYLSSDQAIQ